MRAEWATCLGETVVTFIDENAKKGSPEGEAGTVDLPRPKSCDTHEAAEARALVQALLDRFPHSAVAAKFQEAEATDES